MSILHIFSAFFKNENVIIMKKIDKSEINIPAAVSLKKIIESMPTKIKSSRKALKKFSITFIYSPTKT